MVRITTTPLQAASVYASLVNGGKIIKPNLIKQEKKISEIMISKETSESINKILRKVILRKEQQV